MPLLVAIAEVVWITAELVLVLVIALTVVLILVWLLTDGIELDLKILVLMVDTLLVVREGGELDDLLLADEVTGFDVEDEVLYFFVVVVDFTAEVVRVLGTAPVSQTHWP